jgi:hypothetical protein
MLPKTESIDNDNDRTAVFSILAHKAETHIAHKTSAKALLRFFNFVRKQKDNGLFLCSTGASVKIPAKDMVLANKTIAPYPYPINKGDLIRLNVKASMQTKDKMQFLWLFA